MIDFKDYIKDLQSEQIDNRKFVVQALMPRVKFPLSNFAKKYCWLDISFPLFLNAAKQTLNNQRYCNIKGRKNTWPDFRIVFEAKRNSTYYASN